MSEKFIKAKKKFKRFRRQLSLLKRDIFIIRYYNNLKINENLILLESKNGKDVAGNIFYIIKELSGEKYKDYQLVLALREDTFNKIEHLFSNYGIKNVEFVKIGTAPYYKYLFSAKYLFNDTSFPAAFIKKESQIYVNTWHGTPLKKLGRNVAKRAYSIGNVQKNFLMADYLLYPNPFMEEKMMEAFMLKNLTNAKVMHAGYPRNSVFFNEEAGTKLKRKLGLEGHQVIIYMPTWRGILTKKSSIDKQIESLENYFSQIDRLLHDNQLFYVKLHPFVKDRINYENYTHIKPLPSNYETYDLLNMSDCLVTDYSSVFFDYGVSRKKIILFTYDEDEYIENSGLYIPLTDLPFPKVYEVNELIKEVNYPKNYNDTSFINRFCTYDEANAAKHICEYVIYNKSNDKLIIKDIVHENKENVLIYSGSLAKNGITSSLLSLLETIDLNERNYYICFRAPTVRIHTLTLFNISKDIDYISMVGEPNFNFMEALALVLFNKLNISNKFTSKHLDEFYKRNLKKYFPGIEFDMVIHFTGYEKKVTALLQRLNSRKAIFVHNDMVQEINTKGNQHYLTLKKAYNNYDKVAVVNDDLRSSTAQIKGHDNDIVLVENFFDYKSILKKSKKELVFDDDTRSNVSLSKLNHILKSSALKFITIGRFSHEKGHMRLLNVFNKFYKENKDSYLIIIGGYGKLYQKTMNYAQELECNENIIIIRSISNPFPILKQCDLFILSSFYEGLGLVLLEANVLGVKSFSTDVVGPQKLMKRYNGLLVENSEEGIYKGMQYYVDGKISLLDIDYKGYNKKTVGQFNSLFGE
jgi:Putative glycosyl/glycerophosphate transferases involved in teichoic acid biosynthesis TagF/TagB/EpsJ/RodC